MPAQQLRDSEKRAFRRVLIVLIAGLMLAMAACAASAPMLIAHFPSLFAPSSFSSDDIPAYAGNASVVINGNHPFFSPDELTTVSFEHYSELDALGRCGPATACLHADDLPTEPRGSIGMVKPSGWQTVRYDDLIDGKYLYNRCHLIAYALSGENANPLNLITGTREMNVSGMLSYETRVINTLKKSDMHVLYRATPIFSGSDLLARGVLLEAMSVEDNGRELSFCVFCYNVQPGIVIDYATGLSHAE